MPLAIPQRANRRFSRLVLAVMDFPGHRDSEVNPDQLDLYPTMEPIQLFEIGSGSGKEISEVTGRIRKDCPWAKGIWPGVDGVKNLTLYDPIIVADMEEWRRTRAEYCAP